MVERSLSMREVRGSMPLSSNVSFFYLHPVYSCSHSLFLSYRWKRVLLNEVRMVRFPLMNELCWSLLLQYLSLCVRFV